MSLPRETIEWLLAAPELYVRYQALRLLQPAKADPALLDDDPFVQETLRGVARWRDEVLARHDQPGLALHRLAMLADLGVTPATQGARPVIEGLLANIDERGTFPLSILIPKAFGGSGEPTRAWLICDFPLVVFALACMGVQDERLERARRRLEALATDDGYSCGGSLPRFKGPGPRGGLCPYANLLVARALAADAHGRRSAAARRAAEVVLAHWTERTTKKPFLFGMGTDFAKLKFPFVWYNILHVLTALHRLPGITDDARYRELAELARRKLDAAGRVKPESIYLVYKGHEWTDKKRPSRLLTVFVHRVLGSLGTATEPS